MIFFTKTHPDAIAPTRAHITDAGFDLHACETITIPPGGVVMVGTGIQVALPPGHAGLVCPRSGLARNHSVTVANAPGVIDSGYRGDVGVLLANHGDEEYVVRAGDRVAQLLITNVRTPKWQQVDELPWGGRGDSGFGSTGK